jgi:hypothetical protein
MQHQSIPPSFDTVTEALQWLATKGYTHDFNLDNDCLRFNSGTQAMSPQDFTIEYVFRFEGETDPGDENIVYGINSDTFKLKGVMVSAFGVYADEISDEMLKKLSTH